MVRGPTEDPLLSTPHVLSQVSDLAKLNGPEFYQARGFLKTLAGRIDEHNFPARDLVEHEHFHRIGLADVSVSAACAQGHLVLTADFALWEALTSTGLDAVNFNHVRQLGWDDLTPQHERKRRSRRVFS